MKSIIYFIVFLVLIFGRQTTSAQKFHTVVLHGFNTDVVADGDNKDSVTSASPVGLDGVGWVFTAGDFIYKGHKPGYFLPENHILNSDSIKTLSYLLAPYNANNALLLSNGSEKGTLTFDTSEPAHTVYILGTTGSGDANVVFTVYFSDGTSQVYPGESFPDWFRSTSEVIIHERFSLKDNYFEVIADNPGFSRATLKIDKANTSKPIVRIGAKSDGNNFCAIMAVSIEP